MFVNRDVFLSFSYHARKGILFGNVGYVEHGTAAAQLQKLISYFSLGCRILPIFQLACPKRRSFRSLLNFFYDSTPGTWAHHCR